MQTVSIQAKIPARRVAHEQNTPLPGLRLNPRFVVNALRIVCRSIFIIFRRHPELRSKGITHIKRERRAPLHGVGLGGWWLVWQLAFVLRQLPAGPFSAAGRGPSRSLNERFSRQTKLGMTSRRLTQSPNCLRTSLLTFSASAFLHGLSDNLHLAR